MRRLLIRLVFCFIIAIPTFLIGVVWMSLVPQDDPIRMYWDEAMWAGKATRLEWALFFLATPVQFGIADVFHRRALKEVRALWRRGSPTPLLRRFYRFGSMNLLVGSPEFVFYIRMFADVLNRYPWVFRYPTLRL